jgi:transcriptional regulator with XRE-family HTH domain
MNINNWTDKPFHEAIKEIKEKRNLSYGQIGMYSGLSPQYIQMIVNQKVNVPKPKYIEQIAKGLKLKPIYFKEYRIYLMQSEAKNNPEYERQCFENYLKNKEAQEAVESKKVSEEVSQ